MILREMTDDTTLIVGAATMYRHEGGELAIEGTISLSVVRAG